MRIVDRAATFDFTLGGLMVAAIVVAPVIAVIEALSGHGTNDRAEGRGRFLAFAAAHLVAYDAARQSANDGTAQVTFMPFATITNGAPCSTRFRAMSECMPNAPGP